MMFLTDEGWNTSQHHLYFKYEVIWKESRPNVRYSAVEFKSFVTANTRPVKIG